MSAADNTYITQQQEKSPYRPYPIKQQLQRSKNKTPCEHTIELSVAKIYRKKDVYHLI